MVGFDVLDHLDLEDAVALAAIQDDNVQPCISELPQPIFVLGSSTDCGCTDELLRVWEFGGEGVVEVFHQIGSREEGDEVVGGVDDGEFALFGLA